MACAAQHHFELDFALRRASWQPAKRFGYGGWQAGARNDVFNRLATYPAEIGDWLWQKQPWVETVITWGLTRTRETFARGDHEAAAMKFALLSHYATESLAVANTWLEFIGDNDDFADAASFCIFHDPVANVPAEVIARAKPRRRSEPLSRLRAAARKHAYELGRRVFGVFFKHGAEACWPVIVTGIHNSAPAALALAEAVAARMPPKLSAPSPELVEMITRGWVMRELFEAPDAAAIRAHLAGDAPKAALRRRLGWSGADIFHALDRCSPAACDVYWRWRTDRDVWRAIRMRGVLPHLPRQKVAATWQPGPQNRRL